MNNIISATTGKTLNGIENRMDALLTLGYTLGYRLEDMTMATYYEDFSGLAVARCINVVL